VYDFGKSAVIEKGSAAYGIEEKRRTSSSCGGKTTKRGGFFLFLRLWRANTDV